VTSNTLNTLNSLSLNTKPIQPLSGPNLRFGTTDKPNDVLSLPHWTQQVKDPSITFPDFWRELNDFTQRLQGKNKLGFFSKIRQLFKLVRSFRKLSRELQGSRYLSAEIQKELTRYHRTPSYWWNRIVNPKQCRLMDVVYKGPMSIKAKQQIVSLIPLSRIYIKTLEDQAKNAGSFALFLKLSIFMMNRKLKQQEDYAPLLNKVPALPYSQFEKQLSVLKAEYNKNQSQDPITTIEKEPIGTGSMGQVYQAITQSGKELVLKVIRPNLTETFLHEYLPNIYYKNLLLEGTRLQAKHTAVQNAQNTVNLLKDEVQPEQEAVNTRAMKKWADKIQTHVFQIPEVLAFSKTGLILPYVGEKDLADATLSEQAAIKAKLAPELARFLLLSSAKPLDLHNGNIRIGKPAYWIDHGRQVNLPGSNHQLLLHLMLATFKAPKSNPALSFWNNALLQADTRAQLKNLLEVSPKQNQKALQQLASLDKMDNLSQDVIHQAELELQLNQARTANALKPESETEKHLQKQLDEVQQKLQAFNATKAILTQVLGQFKDGIQKPKLSFINQHTRAQSQPEVQPSVLNAWANASMGLPGFSPSKLPQADFMQYKQKTRGFLGPYLQADRQAETDRKLDALSSELADALIKQCTSTVSEPEKAHLIKTIGIALRQDLPLQASGNNKKIKEPKPLT
jgi:predicted unusual protein kinase regulating ubiquinone biosynthesis (AarF/ABC1/UbiB family)